MDFPSKKITNDSNQFTTFVQADTKTFKDVVQRLTGSSDEAGHDSMAVTKGNFGVKKPDFKLHERRQYKAKLEIIKPPLSIKQGGAVWQQHNQEQHKFSPSSSGSRVLQTSPMNTPTKCFSNLSLVESRGEIGIIGLNSQEEERAIEAKRFYLHPSPRLKPGFSEPELLSLFPVTSPRKDQGV